MKRRRIVLLVCAFLCFLALAGIFKLLGPKLGSTQHNGSKESQRERTPVERRVAAPKKTSVPESTEGMELWSEERDPYTGRLKSIYRVRRWHKRSDGTYILTEPNVTLYQKNGQQITITSDGGQVIAEEIAGRPHVRSGKLTGNVKVFFDRDTDADRIDSQGKMIPAEQRANVVRIYVDEVNFDSEDLEIYTDSDIKLLSKEADIYGTGLRLLWKENPQELRRLEIKHGKRMVVHNLAANRSILSLPGKNGEATPRSKESPIVTKSAEQDVAASHPKPTSKPASKDNKKGNNKDIPRRNTFLAEFLAEKNDLTVINGKQKLTGARKLSLTFQFEPSGDSLSPDRKPAKAKQPNTQEKPSAQTVAADTKPTTKAAASQPQQSQPLVVTWDGPLILTPAGYTPDPNKREYKIEATGGNMVLSDEETTAFCTRFTYNNAMQSGLLSGTNERPACIKLSGGEEIVSQTIAFDRLNGAAALMGKGYMTRSKSRSGSGSESALTTTQASSQPSSERIQWSNRVSAVFGEDSGSGESKVRQYIKQATFVGEVELTQGKSGDFVRCDILTVKMGRTKDRRTYPTWAKASGNAYARQDTATITGDELEVFFKPTGKKKAKAGSESNVEEVEPERLIAKGNVKIEDKGAKEVVWASGQYADSDVTKGTATIKGSNENPAKVGQGDNVMTGATIRMWQAELASSKPSTKVKKQYVHVDGKGNLEFLTDRGLNGNELKDARKIKISWTDHMQFHPKSDEMGQIVIDRNIAEFHGEVKVDSGLDGLSCKSLEVEFLEVAKSEQKVAESEKGKVGVSVASYSKQDVIKLTADRDVKLSILDRDPQGQLLRRLEVHGDKLVYDVWTGVVNMLSPGKLLSEDYRQQKEKSSASSTTRLDWPSLTAFAWKKEMVLSQSNRQAVLTGDVVMQHRSGRHVLPMVKDLNVPKWSNVPDGRKTSLSCNEMLVRFAAPIKDKTDKPDKNQRLDVGSRLGPLDVFNATGNVNLIDGPRQLIGQRLMYEREPDVVLTYGYLEGKPKANAELIEKDFSKMTERTISSPRIIWYRKTNEFRWGEVSGMGGL